MLKSPNAPDGQFFESLYRDRDDPWDFATSDYEQGRFAAILRALAPARYRHAFEPACSIGTLTVGLAGCCDLVTACDVSETAVARARERCLPFPQITLVCAPLTRETSVEDYDLIVLSELGYYFPKQDWLEVVSGMVAKLRPGAIVLASHWLGSHPTHLQTADEVHGALHGQPLLEPEIEQIHPGFRLDRFRRLHQQL